jgi:mannose-6-phosphate isomerase-like protein (cupin superfamily)
VTGARVFPIDDLVARQRGSGERWWEFEQGPSLTAGVYVLDAGAVDDQEPHAEDEVYVVVAGRARFTAGDRTWDVGPGDTIHVPAGLPHRYHDIVEPLRIVYTLTPPGAPAR